jgi:DNA-directed RNA polymerase sigma subunit (sigma70/sigma32)
MKPATRPVSKRQNSAMLLPSYVYHTDFAKRSAARQFDAAPLLAADVNYDSTYMPDDVTREHSKRMHYAAHKMHTAKSFADFERAQRSYLALRDRIVLGNRKLVYRCVHRRAAQSYYQDDFEGECHIVLIQAVAAFNPWLGIRFSTYAYPCLVRALSRSAQKLSSDWQSRAIPLGSLPDGELADGHSDRAPATGPLFLDEFLRDDHPLLTPREKSIIARRFSVLDDGHGKTLETVGREMGLSKERVRQVQTAALQKLRTALAAIPA